MRRAALYARYSSDLQSPASIDDQLTLCRTYCRREGFAVAGEYADRAVSGASLHGRAGIADLMGTAQAGAIDVVVVESLDRISRSMKDLAGIHEELSGFLGIDIIEVHAGRADTIQIGVRGLVGALYLSDLAQKTRRGLAGKLRQGMRAGGLPYGYRPISGKPGQHEIYEPEADIVRRIFGEYADGKTPRAIAAGLNNDGAKPPRGRAWNASTLNGSAKRASGLLSNEIYRGEIVWNKVGKVKNPRTGKRVPRINASDVWERAAAPHLRIVDEELWRAVEVRRLDLRRGPRIHQRRPQRPFSGLLKCAVCGSGIVSAGSDHGHPIAQCSRVRESGDCTNKRRIRLDVVEKAIFDELGNFFARPDHMAAYVAEYHRERRRLATEATAERGKLERRLMEIERQIGRLVDAIAEGSGAVALVSKVAELEKEQQALRHQLDAIDDPDDTITLHPAAVQRFHQMVEDVGAELMREGRDKALKQVRELVDCIVIEPRQRGGDTQFTIQGRFANFLFCEKSGATPWAPFKSTSYSNGFPSHDD